MEKNNNIVTIVSQTDSIDFVIRKMSMESKLVLNPGISIVLDDNFFLQGILTDGDIRRAYVSNIDFSRDVSEIMTSSPVTLQDSVPESEITSEIMRLVRLDERFNADFIRHIIIVDKSNRFVNILEYYKILDSLGSSVASVAIYGMGYVGVTLAVSLANIGYQVRGIDIDQSLVDMLNNGKSHVHEPNLEELLGKNISSKKIEFKLQLQDNSCSVYIIAVGTPLDENGKPVMDSLNQVLESLSSKLKHGDQVMLRSTVPVGTTRDIVIPFLEKHSGLIAGEDFCVTFAPERTIEGNAMYELKNLPQIVGGYGANCTKRSLNFWSTLTPHVVKMPSLESAELVKLANNTFRDVSFAFANELALLADRYNVDAFDLINCANEGYTRNKIPLPSPGVGGYCLTKDPVLFSSTSKGYRDDAVLGIASRKINEKAAQYPHTLIKRYSKRIKKPINSLSILIIGIAFKGNPETNDIRGSVAIDLFNKIKKDVLQVLAWDAVLSRADLEVLGFNTPETLDEGIKQSDVVLIINNHLENTSPYFYNSNKGRKLIFDGWSQLDRLAIENLPDNVYATMGYMTKE